jgi:uncharacterized protein (TIGR02246 family)
MFRRFSLRPLVLLCTVVSCSAPGKTPEASAEPTVLLDAIQAREKEWSAAFLAKNAAGIAALYTDDAAQVQPAGEWVRGTAGITQAMQAQFDTINVTTREDITEEVIPAGEYAVEIGHYSYQGTSKTSNKPLSNAGRYMVLWKKDAAGTWRLHRDIGNDAPVAKAEATPMKGAATAPKKP